MYAERMTEPGLLRIRLIGIFLVATFLATQMPAFAGEPGREFSAELKAEFRIGGGNRMLVNLVIDRHTSIEEAQQLAEVLARGGQRALLAALKGRVDGRIRLGATDFPVALVVAEPQGRGYRYLFLTPRQIGFDERELNKDSLDYPFGVIDFEVDRFGRGEGSLHVAAALSIDESGHVELEDYDGSDGEIQKIKQIR
jgi:hypothetical protein